MSSSNNATFAAIAEALRNHQTFVVISHIRPDGDAIGSELAMALCLKQLGKDVKVWNEDGMIDWLRFLPGAEMLTQPPSEPESFDVAIVLDTAVKVRAGNCIPAVKEAKLWINMDHHVTNERYGDLVYVDSIAPATGEILYEFVRSENLPFTHEMADNIYTAISTDTGSFQYPNTTARTYEIAAELIKAGVAVGDISRKLYQSSPRRRVELLKEMLNVMRFTSNDRVASAAMSLERVKAAGALPEDTEGQIDHLRSIDTVLVAAFFEEMADGKIRVSLRSKDPRVDVSKICTLFGGGGHTLAAGARKKGTLEEVSSQVLKAIDDALPH